MNQDCGCLFHWLLGLLVGWAVVEAREGGEQHEVSTANTAQLSGCTYRTHSPHATQMPCQASTYLSRSATTQGVDALRLLTRPCVDSLQACTQDDGLDKPEPCTASTSINQIQEPANQAPCLSAGAPNTAPLLHVHDHPGVMCSRQASLAVCFVPALTSCTHPVCAKLAKRASAAAS